VNLDSRLRKFVPSLAKLTHNRLVMFPLDVIDRLVNLPFREARRLPPNRFRLRVGVDNRLLFNAFHYRYHAVDFWMHAFAEGLASPTSDILDIGCGCGRYAVVLRRLNYKGWRFTGTYAGLDIDREMIAWCQRHFPPKRFKFVWADRYSKVYNPTGQEGEYRLPFGDASFDFVFSTSLFTHLLEADLTNYLRETARVLRPGGTMSMSVFCLDTFREQNWLGERFTFAHTIGPAYIESEKYPEAAVAYPRQYLIDACEAAGLHNVTITGGTMQQDLRASKPR
jgi:SAM-dependent methyltransferase